MSGRLAIAEPIVGFGQKPPKKHVLTGERDADGLVRENALDQAKIAAYARRPYNNGSSLPRPGWIHVNLNDIREANEIYKNNPHVRIPIQINLNALLGGGITFERKGQVMNEDLKGWFSTVWLNFIKDAIRNLWLFGFAVWTWVPQPGAGAIPCVVPPEKLEIMFKLNILGEPMWAVRELESMHLMPYDDDQTKAPLLRNFYVHTWNVPDYCGNLTSKVLSLRQTVQFLEQLKRCAVIAEIGKCRPAVITEEVETKQDVKLSGVFTSGESDLQENFTDEALTHYTSRKIQQMNSMSRDEFVNLTTEIRYMFESQFGDHLGPRLDLPKHRKLARYPLPQAPDHIKEFMLLVQQQSLMVFGIPPAMIQAESSKGKINLDMNAQAMYAHHLLNLKQEVLAMVNGIYRIIYGGQYIAEYLLQTPMTKRVTTDEALESARVTITMPGIPPENVIDELYAKGVLKYDAYRQYISSNYSIPLEHLESTPKLSVKDLLTGGKTDKPEPKAAAKRKATAKPKSKSKTTTAQPKKKKAKTS